MFRNEVFDQEQVRENYNYLVGRLNNELGLHLDYINRIGLCSGLDSNYLLYAKSNRRDEFQIYVNFIASFSKKIIDDFITQCLQAKKDKKNLWKVHIKVPLTNANNKQIPDEWVSISFEKLITFMEGVQAAHKNQAFQAKAIGANWDRNATFICNEKDLATCLKQAQIANGQFMSFSMGAHAFSLERTSEGFYLFEPNAIKKAIKLIPLKDENEVARVIKNNIKNSNIYARWNNNVGFTIKFLSYGNANREVDDAMHKFQNKKEQLLATNLGAESIWPNALQSLVDQYQKGKISRVDFAIEMCDSIEKSFSKDDILIDFKNALRQYLSDKIEQDVLLNTNQKMINHTAYRWDTSWLYLATQANQIGLVKKITDKKIELNQLTDGITPLYVASQYEYTQVVEILVNALAKANADLNKLVRTGATPLHVAVHNGYIQVAEILVNALANANADLNKPIDKGITPLFLAAQNGYTAIVKILLAKNVDASFTFKSTQELLSDFADKRQVRKSMDALIQSKIASGESPSAITLTPLEIAKVMGHEEVVKLLIDNKANNKIDERENKSPQNSNLLFTPATEKVNSDKKNSTQVKPRK